MWLDNLNRMRKESGLSLDELSDISGVPKGTLAKITSGITKAPALETIKSLVYAMGFTLAELDDVSALNSYSPEERDHIKKYRPLDVYGKEAVDAVLNAEYKRLTKIIDKKEEGWTTYINCYDLAVSAGPGEPWVNDACVTQLKIPTERVPENAHYCARVNGDSMEPAYKDGDIVFVQRLEGCVSEGEIGIFFLNGEGYIKRLGDGELLSLNPEYAPIPLHDFDEFQCQGRVLGKV